jgi:hypothetical protein
MAGLMIERGTPPASRMTPDLARAGLVLRAGGRPHEFVDDLVP